MLRLRSFTLLLVVGLAMGVAGCGKKPADLIQKTWRVKDMKFDFPGVNQESPEFGFFKMILNGMRQQSIERLAFEFKPEGELVMHNAGQQSKGKWKLADSNLVLTHGDSLKTQYTVVEITDTSLTMRYIEKRNDEQIVFTYFLRPGELPKAVEVNPAMPENELPAAEPKAPQPGAPGQPAPKEGEEGPESALKPSHQQRLALRPVA